MQDTQGSIPGSGASSLEEKMATHSSIPAWRIPWTEEPGGLHGVTELDTTEWLTDTSVSILSNLIFIYIQRALCEYKKTQAISTACFNLWK